MKHTVNPGYKDDSLSDKDFGWGTDHIFISTFDCTVLQTGRQVLGAGTLVSGVPIGSLGEASWDCAL